MSNPYAPPAASPTEPVLRTRFQVVGRHCAQCDKVISRKTDGVACMACELAYHKTCLVDPDRCAHCAQSMSALERSAAEAEADAARLAHRRGRTLVWAAILPYAVVEFLLVSFVLSSGVKVFPTALRAVLDVVLVWLTLNGNRAARRWLVFLCVVGFLFSLSMLVEASAVLTVILVACLCQTAFAAWVFVLSDDAKAYLDARVGPPAAR